MCAQVATVVTYQFHLLDLAAEAASLMLAMHNVGTRGHDPSDRHQLPNWLTRGSIGLKMPSDKECTYSTETA